MVKPKPSSFDIRPATANDLVAISELVNSAYRGASSRQGWTTEAEYLEGQRTDPETLASDLAQPNKRILCLREAEGAPILACVSLEKFRDTKGHGCYLGMLTVSPSLQATGIGRSLLEGAENFAANWGATRMTLGVIHLRESLINWYLRRGYVESGETKAFPYGDEKFGLPLRDDLQFVMFEKAITVKSENLSISRPPLAQSREVPVIVKCRWEDLPLTQGSVLVEQEPQKVRLKKAYKIFGVFWALMVLSVFIPIAHFILVPLFFLAGPIAAVSAYSIERRIRKSLVVCPKCQKQSPVPEMKERWPVNDSCSHCRTQIVIDVAPAQATT